MVNDTGTFWLDLLFWFLFIIKQAGFFLFVNSDNGGMNEFIVLLRLKIKYPIKMLQLSTQCLTFHDLIKTQK